ncbi:MAG: S46 family peptidase [Candidatus Latescibacterota bacterium]|jgi:hypothetical protein
MSSPRKSVSQRRRRVASALLASFAVAAVLLALGAPSGVADEGMWLPFMLDKSPIESWHARGLELTADEIYNPEKPSVSDAIVQVGGGTGSFVSFDGLIVTNHHVAYGALQRSSSVKTDLINEGFLAPTMSEEIVAPGYEARVLLNVKEVTKDVLKKIKKDMTDLERYKAIEKVQKEIVAKAEKGKDVFAEVKSIYGGSQYYLYTYFKIKDIRIVYAPPEAIGVFGGDVDNWMWPRHTGDFSFLRAYVAPDGKSAEYSEENVPYHPKKYLSVSKRPLKADDFTMVMGYPGSTKRYRTSYSIDFQINTYYPESIAMMRDILDIVEEESARGRAVEIKLASLNRGINNAYKNYVGMLEGLNKADLLAQKIEEEDQLRRYMSANPDLEKKYGHVLDGIKAQYDEYMTFWEQNRLLGMVGYVSSPMRSSLTIYKWAEEQEKKDIDRDPGYQERDEERRRKSLELADLSYDEQTDKRILKYFLMKLAQSDQTQGSIDGINAEVTEEEIDELLAGLYAGTKVTNKEDRMAMFGMSKEELLALDDPFIDFAAKVHVQREKLDDENEAFAGALQKLRPQLMEVRTKFKGGLLYPDANFTMRVSVGQVKGYSPADAVEYYWMTTLTGVVEKTTGVKPFVTPQKLLDLHASGDLGDYTDPITGDVPVCFLSTDDVTGGNSGSPIMNGRGELIGLVFDGNYEAISADYQHIAGLTRTINVDSRYMLFILDKFADARNVLDELKIVGGAPGGPGPR